MFITGKAFTEGPTTDTWGTFITAVMPVKNSKTGEMLAGIGMDIDYSYWQGLIFHFRLVPIFITMLLAFSLITIFIVQYRHAETYDTLSVKTDELRIAKEEAEAANRELMHSIQRANQLTLEAQDASSRQKRISGNGEPRNTHPDEWNHRHERVTAGNPSG
ncbi:MAG: hypothetical protein ACYC4Q_04960 [Victivallaceae bacterium]